MYRSPHVLIYAAFLSAGALLAADAAKPRVWTFDRDTVGQIASGFSDDAGKWVVVDSGEGRALAQTAKNDKPAFNVTLVKDPNARNIDLSVRLKAIAGKIDQGGGLVWRAQNAENYYLARYNPLEDNFRLYTVIDGKRTQLANADIPCVTASQPETAQRSEWRTLRVTMRDAHIECFLDGQKCLAADDKTLSAAGKIGLWSKADAQTHFDDLTLVGD